MTEDRCPICDGNDIKEINRPANCSNAGNTIFIINYMRCRDCESTYYTCYQSRRNKIEYLYAIEKHKKNMI